MKNKYEGFTLAEVLITLLIIGVVASLTIPTLINNTNKAEYITKLKKEYAALSQAVLMTQANNDGTLGYLGGNMLNQFANNMVFISKNSHNCGSGSCDGASSSYWYPISTLKELSGAAYPQNWPAWISNDSQEGVLADGSLWKFTPQGVSSTCSSYPDFCDNNALAFVDINGKTGPNTVGRDVFLFDITRSGSVYPYGTKTYSYSSPETSTDCSKSSSGYSCSNYILSNGVMDY